VSRRFRDRRNVWLIGRMNQGNQSSNQSQGGQLTCYGCGGQGHRKAQCPTGGGAQSFGGGSNNWYGGKGGYGGGRNNYGGGKGGGGFGGYSNNSMASNPSGSDVLTFGDVSSPEVTLTVRCKENEMDMLKARLREPDGEKSKVIEKVIQGSLAQPQSSPGTKQALSRLESQGVATLAAINASTQAVSVLGSKFEALDQATKLMGSRLNRLENDMNWRSYHQQEKPGGEFQEWNGFSKYCLTASKKARKEKLGIQYVSELLPEDEDENQAKGEIALWACWKWKNSLAAIKGIVSDLGLEDQARCAMKVRGLKYSQANFKRRKYTLGLIVDAVYDQDYELPDGDRDAMEAEERACYQAEEEQQPQEDGDCQGMCYVIQFYDCVKCILSVKLCQLYSTLKKEGSDKKTEARIRVFEDLLTLCRMILVVIRPVNGQQGKIANQMWDDFEWCVWRTFFNPRESSYEKGYGDLYAIVFDGGAGEYIGSTWTLGRRKKEHIRSGTKDRNDLRIQEVDAWKQGKMYRTAMKQRVYRVMDSKGVHSLSMFAIGRVHFRKQEGGLGTKTDRNRFKRMCKKVVEKAEHDLCRRVDSKLNDRGMKRNMVRSSHAMRPGVKERTKARSRLVVGACGDHKKVIQQVTTKTQRLALYRIQGEERHTVDLVELLGIVKRGDSIEVSNGVRNATDWRVVRRCFGASTVECDGGSFTIQEWADRWCSNEWDLKRTVLVVKSVINFRCAEVKGVIVRPAVKAVVRWYKNCAEWKLLVPSLADLQQWEQVLSMVPGMIRLQVRKKLRWAIKKAGGSLIPIKVTVRIPAGATVKRTDIRRWWYGMIDNVKADEDAGRRRRWKAALQITNGVGDKIEDELVNATKKCADANLSNRAVSTECVCTHMPELVSVMKTEYSEAWRDLKHIHMSAADVPWQVQSVGSMNVRSEMVGGDRNAASGFWDSLSYAAYRACDRSRATADFWLQEAQQNLQVQNYDKLTEMAFKVGAVAEFKRMCDRGSGLVRTVLDRDVGQLWLTCPVLHGEFGRDHFKYAKNKEEWDEWGAEHDERPNYWRVDKTASEILKEWRAKYDHINKAKCGGRWKKWEVSGSLTRARWQYKKKDTKRIRAIFNGVKDPAVKEMAVTAKCVSLIRETLGTNDFSLSCGLKLDAWLELAEAELGNVFGENTELRVDGTDFKNFFPCNKKSDMVGLLQTAVDMIFSGVCAQGWKVPVNKWITVPTGVKEKAVWGRRTLEGAQRRRVSDVIEFIRFRAEVANIFSVGDVNLQGEEVIIGEKISPAMCEIKAKLDEHALHDELDEVELGAVRCRRYVDDGIRVSAVDCSGVIVDTSVADRVGDKISNAYPGITVTDEGGADRTGLEHVFLEFKIGVSDDGKKLRWWHHNKNIEQIASDGKQKFKKLKHWRSGSAKRQMLGTLRARLDAIALMTRKGFVTGGQRGSGNWKCDVCRSALELFTELHVALQYPLRDLVCLVRRMGRTSELWADILVNVQVMKNEFDVEERLGRRRKQSWRIVGESMRM
jgi:hypothetical protein